MTGEFSRLKSYVEGKPPGKTNIMDSFNYYISRVSYERLYTRNNSKMTDEELIEKLARAMWQSDFDLLGYDDPKVADEYWNVLSKMSHFNIEWKRKAKACLPVIDEYVDSICDDTPLVDREVEDEYILFFPLHEEE